MTPPYEEFFQQYFSPLTLEVDQHDRIVSWQGDLTHYGIGDTDVSGETVTRYLPCLIALPHEQNISLPLVNLTNNRVADIHVQPRPNGDTPGGYRVVLIDATTTQESLQKNQQLAHDVSLVNEKLEELSNSLQEKNRQLDIANRAKADFISGLSHEFRTPIASVLGHARWLKQRCQNSNNEQLESLETIERSGEYLLTLIENLLRQGSIDADKLVLSPSIIELKPLLQSLLDMVKPLAEEKSLSLSGKMELEDHARFKLDGNYLRQAIVNLLSNAIKFTDEGHVYLNALYTDETLHIEVVDSGIGIDPQSLQHLTSSFTRGKNAVHRPGLGLGLSIVQGIVTAMNGRFEIRPGTSAGTVASLSIPAPMIALPAIDPTAQARGTVMLLDDNKDITNLYRLFFKEAGIDLRTYTDPAEFMEDIPPTNPELLITDYHLHDTNGLSVVRQLREQGHQHPAVLLTATLDIDAELRARAEAAGCNDCWVKPVKVEELIAQVRNCL